MNLDTEDPKHHHSSTMQAPSILDRKLRKQLKLYGHLFRMEDSRSSKNIYFSVGSALKKEKRKTAKIMEEPSDGFHEKQNHGGRYGVWE